MLDAETSPTRTSMPSGFGARPDDVDRLRMTLLRDEEDCFPFLSLERVAHGHRFGGGGRFVEERSVRDLQPGQIDDHRLEIQQRFEAALRDLGLVRRVGRVPAGFSRMFR